MNGWVDGSINKWMKRKMDGLRDGWMGRWMDN